MKKEFEEILERLEEAENILLNEAGDIGCTLGITNMSEYSKQIVQEVAEEYNDGWIPVSERLPEERDWCLAVFEEVDTGFIGIPYIAEYLMGNHTIATTEDGWIIHNCTDIEHEYAEYYKKLRCVSWMPLPEPYKAESEVEKNDRGRS